MKADGLGTNYDPRGRITALDLETTGLDLERDRIIEIGAVELWDGRITGLQYNIRINPEIPIPARATEIHGISDNDVKNSPTFYEVAEKFEAFISESRLLGHFIRGFDLHFLRRQFAEAGVDIELRPGFRGTICTVEMAEIMFPDEHGDLSHLCELCGVNPGRPHSALDDALASAGCYIQMWDLSRYFGEEQT